METNYQRRKGNYWKIGEKIKEKENIGKQDEIKESEK